MSINKSVPHLSYILICDDAAMDEKGNLNVEGILSRYLYVNEPVNMPPLRLNIKVVLGTYCEDEFATHTIRFAILAPDGIEADLGNSQIGYLDGEYHPIKIIDFGFLIGAPGTYWIKVYLGARVWGQYPLTISYLQMSNS